MISSKTYIAFTKFIIVGGLCFLLDLGVYYGTFTFIKSYIAKALGIVIATFVNYKLNKYWTWELKKQPKQSNSGNPLKNYLLLYAISGCVNVLTNEFLLNVLPNWELELNMLVPDATELGISFNTTKLFAMKSNKLLAVLCATALGMIINFLGQKLWVFGKRKEN